MKISKTIQKLTVIIAILAVVFLVTSCVKEGPVGPVGPPGNANVNAHTFEITSWLTNSTNFYVDLYVSDLTNDVQANGTVQVFLSTNNGVEWNALPMTYVSSPYYIMTYSTQTQHVYVDWVYSGSGLGNNPNSIYGTNCLFKVVVIPPAYKKPNVNNKNYVEVKKAYNLKD